MDLGTIDGIIEAGRILRQGDCEPASLLALKIGLAIFVNRCADQLQSELLTKEYSTQDLMDVSRAVRAAHNLGDKLDRKDPFVAAIYEKLRRKGSLPD